DCDYGIRDAVISATLDEMKREHSKAYREANRRLHNYYVHAAPTVLGELETLARSRAAVQHALASGRTVEAFGTYLAHHLVGASMVPLRLGDMVNELGLVLQFFDGDLRERTLVKELRKDPLACGVMYGVLGTTIRATLGGLADSARYLWKSVEGFKEAE